MERALSIPEIRIHLGWFLSVRDLKNCMTLSKAWTESLAPCLWCSVTVSIKDNSGSLETVSKYVDHVRTLRLDNVTLSNAQYAQFRSLKYINFSYVPTSPTYEDDIIALIKRNRPTLRTLHAMDCHRMPTKVLRTILDSPSLKNLSLHHPTLQEKELAEELLQTCTRLTTLSVNLANSSGWSMLCTPTQVFQQLTILKMYYLDHPDHLGFLKACPNLRMLILRPNDTISLNEITSALLASCPKLSTLLSYHSRIFSIEDLERLSHGLPPMKCLQVLSFGISLNVVTPNVISRHFATLQYIKLEAAFDCTGPSVQIILTSCPSLRYISGGTLCSQDIDPQVPWVCLGLEHFGVQTQRYRDEQSLIWSQLARLTRLCSLTIGVKTRPPPLSDPTPFGLDEGLEILAPLKRLAHLEIRGSSLEWHEKEVKWVIQSWPNLSSIHGEIQLDKEKQDVLWRRLNSSGIFFWRPDIDFLEYVDLH